MTPTRASTAVLLTFFSCNQPVIECPPEGCAPAPLSMTEVCVGLQSDFFCSNPKRCGLADPSASCEAINKNLRFEAQSLCWLQEREAVDAGRLTYDATAARECLAGLQARACFSTATVPACERVFTGRQALGAECFSGPECVTGAWCDLTSTCPGRCTALARPGDVVPDVLGCARDNAAVDQGDGGWRCQAPLPSGAICRAANESVFGTACQSPTDTCTFPFDGGPGRCEPARSLLQPRGAACDLTQRCQRGLGCRAVAGQATGRCDDLIPLGQSCERDFNGCVIGAMCGRDLRCVAEPRLGEACTATCARGSKCVNAVCVAEGSSGAACPCEFGLQCIEGRCQPPRCD